MMRQRLFYSLVLGALAMGSAHSAKAQYCGGGWEYGYGYLYNILRYEVPHFAAFPPVYYSEPVPRTYGYSPFAYPPHVMTPEIVGESQPLSIDNPYVPKKSGTTPAKKADRTAKITHVEPLVVVNPYVSQTHQVAKSQ